MGEVSSVGITTQGRQWENWGKNPKEMREGKREGERDGNREGERKWTIHLPCQPHPLIPHCQPINTKKTKQQQSKDSSHSSPEGEAPCLWLLLFLSTSIRLGTVSGILTQAMAGLRCPSKATTGQGSSKASVEGELLKGRPCPLCPLSPTTAL